MQLAFPLGYQRFHENLALNFQLNRFLPGARAEDWREVAPRIGDLADWKREMLALAEAAEAAGRLANAATYFRAAEFFIGADDPDGDRAYQRFVELFEKLHAGEDYERHEVPYAGAALPALRLPCEGAKDVLVMHGGFDSFQEELYPWAAFLRKAGFEVILFEGPGQGAALKHHRLTMIPEWEHPVGAVLDAFGLERASLLGISLGGYLAPRAAAFEPRIRRVIAFDVLCDFLECMTRQRGPLFDRALRLLLALRAERVVNAAAQRLVRTDLLAAWGIPHGMRVMGAASPYALLRKVRRFNTLPFSPQIRQDFLLLAGSADHYVPLRQFHRQARALTNVRSFTGRIFTEAEQAQNHCQVGNLELALRTIADWLEERIAAERRG